MSHATAVRISAIALLANSAPAAARARGIPFLGCDGCHNTDQKAEVTLTASPPSFGPGAMVTMTISITARGANPRVGGVYVPMPVGTLRAIAGEGLVANNGLVHERPKAATNGVVTFRFGWQAPTTPGVVTFDISALAANGDNTSSGDVPGSGLFQWVFGCEPRTVYWDGDGDGFGTADVPAGVATRIACVGGPLPPGYAGQSGDCFDFNQSIHPGATEICNLKDDDCDGMIDENAPPVMSWPDDDGDGYYGGASGTPRLACGDLPGYASVGGDCAPRDPTVSPAAKEVCNLKDDNCDARIDELVRPRCGLGTCRREAANCIATDCMPGLPTAETCNLLDDDCDGTVDDNVDCGAERVCFEGACVPAGGNPDGGGPPGTASDGGDASGGGGNGNGGNGATTGGSGGARGGGAGRGGGCSVAAADARARRSPDGIGASSLFVVALVWAARARRLGGTTGRRYGKRESDISSLTR